MKIEPLGLAGACLLRSDRHEDVRGSFRRVVDMAELAEAGFEVGIAQVSMATNRRRGTVRGMHYQAPPNEEVKTLWCTSGAVFDVLVDLRPEQPTYGSWVGTTLRAEDPVALHVPFGMAHGYQTLEQDTTLVYLISTPFAPSASRSLLWQDETVGIRWPLPVACISERDQGAPPWPPGP